VDTVFTAVPIPYANYAVGTSERKSTVGRLFISAFDGAMKKAIGETLQDSFNQTGRAFATRTFFYNGLVRGSPHGWDAITWRPKRLCQANVGEHRCRHRSKLAREGIRRRAEDRTKIGQNFNPGKWGFIEGWIRKSKTVNGNKLKHFKVRTKISGVRELQFRRGSFSMLRPNPEYADEVDAKNGQGYVPRRVQNNGAYT